MGFAARTSGPPQAAGSEQQSQGLKSTAARGPRRLVLSARRDRDLRLQGQASRSSFSLEKHPGGSQGNQENPGVGDGGRASVGLKPTGLRDEIRACSVPPHLVKGKGLPCRKQLAGVHVLGPHSSPQPTGGPLLPSSSSSSAAGL